MSHLKVYAETIVSQSQAIMDAISLAIETWPRAETDCERSLNDNPLEHNHSAAHVLSEGLARFRKLVQQERDFWQKGVDGDVELTDAHVKSANSPFYRTLLSCLYFYKDQVSDCLRTTRYTTLDEDQCIRKKSVRVDIVTGDDQVWIKVVNKKLRDYWPTLGILEAELSDSDVEFDEDWRPSKESVIQLAFIQQALKYKQAADEDLAAQGVGPKVRVVLLEDEDTFNDPFEESGIAAFEQTVAETLRDLNIELAFYSATNQNGTDEQACPQSACHDIRIVNPISETLRKSNSTASATTAAASTELSLMLDVTTLSALVSNLTHSYPNPPEPESFPLKQHRLQAKYEHTNPVLPQLVEAFKNKRLVTTTSAYRCFADLVNKVGDDWEKRRCHALFYTNDAGITKELEKTAVPAPQVGQKPSEAWISWTEVAQTQERLPRIGVVLDQPSRRIKKLFELRKHHPSTSFNKLHRDVFGTADEMNITLVTANLSTAKIVAQSGISNLKILTHAPRSLVPVSK